MDSHHAHSSNSPEQSSGFSLTTMLALGGAAVITGIILAPYVAPAIGIGDLNVAENALFKMHNFVDGDGLAQTLSNIVSYLPFIGEDLAKGGLMSIGTIAVTGIGGVLAGNWMSEHHDGEGIDWGKVIKWGALATSALIAMPSILTGISNGLIYIIDELVAANMLDPNTVAPVVEMITSKIGLIPYQEAADFGFTGAAVTLPHLLTCGSTLAPLAASLGFETLSHKSTNEPEPVPKNYSFIAKNKYGQPLPFNDPNHYITPKEFALVEEYNNAKPAQKILLKKQILEQGYDPDFHTDGTVHLYKHDHSAHTHSMSR